MNLHGFLNMSKPAGITSRRLVDQVLRRVRPAKAGHAGTLDPLASGVLVVAVGAATRLIQYVHRRPKSYLASFLLGRQSDTEDVEGNVVELAAAPVPSAEDIAAAAKRFTGTFLQRPPHYSALKVDGRRAYELARRGEPLQLEPRPVTIGRLEVVAYRYPELTLSLDCSTGTYVRSLGRDLAQALGTAAVMAALVRTRVADFRLDDALTPERLADEPLAQVLQPALAGVAWMARTELSPSETADVRHGRPIRRSAAEAGEMAALDPSGQLVAVLVPRAPGLWGPTCTIA